MAGDNLGLKLSMVGISGIMLAYSILRKARMMRGIEPEDFRRGIIYVARWQLAN